MFCCRNRQFARFKPMRRPHWQVALRHPISDCTGHNACMSWRIERPNLNPVRTILIFSFESGCVHPTIARPRSPELRLVRCVVHGVLMVFRVHIGREFLAPCAQLEGAYVLAVTAGSSPASGLLPHISTRFTHKWTNPPPAELLGPVSKCVAMFGQGIPGAEYWRGTESESGCRFINGHGRWWAPTDGQWADLIRIPNLIPVYEAIYTRLVGKMQQIPANSSTRRRALHAM